jgi:hypothetical protein
MLGISSSVTQVLLCRDYLQGSIRPRFGNPVASRYDSAEGKVKCLYSLKQCIGEGTTKVLQC